MIKQLTFILLTVLVISCKNKGVDRSKKPDNLIPKDSMVEIIYDVSLINSAKGVNKKLLENKGIVPKDYIYKKHNIDSLQFALSNEYYANNLQNYEEIYNNVKLKLEKDKAHFNAIIAAEQKVRDSLNIIKKKKRDSLRETIKSRTKNNTDDLNLINRRPLKKIDTSRISTRQ